MGGGGGGTVMQTGDTIVEIAHFSTKAERVQESTDLDELYERSKEKILEKISTFQQFGSNLFLLKRWKCD